jgi:hypothetical protein
MEIIRPAESAPNHTLEVFGDAAARTDALVGFVRQGLEAGDHVFVVATKEHWESASSHLLRDGLQIDADIASYRLTVCNAADLLGRCMRGCTIHPERFNTAVAEPLRQLRARGCQLRAYGEMVDLLAADGDLANVLRLEELWSDLLLTEPIDVLCGYSSRNFRGPHTTLSQICRTHSHLKFGPDNDRGGFLPGPDRPGQTRS